MICSHSRECCRDCEHAEEHEHTPRCELPCGCYARTRCEDKILKTDKKGEM